MISNNVKKAALVFGSAFLIFILLRNKSAVSGFSPQSKDDSVPPPSSRDKVPTPKMNAKDAAKNPKSKDAFIALKAYIAAYNNKEPQSALDELNREINKDMGLKVYRRASDGVFIVTDSSGKQIMSNG